MTRAPPHRPGGPDSLGPPRSERYPWTRPTRPSRPGPIAGFEGPPVCARCGDARPEPGPPPEPGAWRGPDPGDWTSSPDRAACTAGMRRIREHIAAGRHPPGRPLSGALRTPAPTRPPRASTRSPHGSPAATQRPLRHHPASGARRRSRHRFARTVPEADAPHHRVRAHQGRRTGAALRYGRRYHPGVRPGPGVVRDRAEVLPAGRAGVRTPSRGRGVPPALTVPRARPHTRCPHRTLFLYVQRGRAAHEGFLVSPRRPARRRMSTVARAAHAHCPRGLPRLDRTLVWAS